MHEILGFINSPKDFLGLLSCDICVIPMEELSVVPSCLTLCCIDADIQYPGQICL